MKNNKIKKKVNFFYRISLYIHIYDNGLTGPNTNKRNQNTKWSPNIKVV